MTPTTPDQTQVLVVDNDDAVTRLLALRLEDAGYACHTAACGSQALAIFQARPVDVVVTDLNMPNGDGATLVSSIRQRSDVPIIVLTGFSDELRAGVRGKGVTLLRKPFDAHAIIDLIEVECLCRRADAA
jgi:CheY-like chemotaxis protein